MRKSMIILIPIILSQTLHCCSTGEDEADFSQLNGESFVFIVDRSVDHPDVQYPRDELQESDYKQLNDGPRYDVEFSADMQTVTLMPGGYVGELEEDDELLKQYNLVDGAFIAGRFNIWIESGHFEAELTEYGSGIPIIRSQRGTMKPAE